MCAVLFLKRAWFETVAELLATERLQPSLLDRLADDEPSDTKESRDKRVLSQKRLRECVLRDLAWLLNSTALDAPSKLSNFPQVIRSVLNYGIPALSGTSVSSADAIEIERNLRQAISAFEPRILKDSLKVRVVSSKELYNHNALAIAIEGDLWMQPLPLRLYLQTEIDLETGHVELIDRGG